MDFTVYDPKTRVVLYRGNASEEDALRHEKPGEAVLLNKAFDSGTQLNEKFEPIGATPRQQHLILLDITMEREKRLATGFTYKEHIIGLTDQDMVGWTEVNNMIYITPGPKYSLETNTGILQVTDGEWTKLWGLIHQHRQPIVLRFFELTRQRPLPENWKW